MVWTQIAKTTPCKVEWAPARSLIRYVNAPVVSDLDAGGDHDFPGMIVRIGEISGIPAVIGCVRGLQQRRAFRDGEIENPIDLLRVAAVPCERHPAKRQRPRRSGKRDVVGELVPREQPDHGGPGVEEGGGFAASAHSS